jgi:hypothetical protein
LQDDSAGGKGALQLCQRLTLRLILCGCRCSGLLKDAELLAAD